MEQKLMKFSRHKRILIPVSILAIFLQISIPAYAQDNSDTKQNTEENQEAGKDNSENKAQAKKLYESKFVDEQTGLYDFDKRFSVVKEKSKYEFNWSFNLLQEFHWYQNADLRKLNSESDTEIRYTDDQMGFAVTRAKIDASVLFPEEKIGLELSWGFDGVWGHDQLQGYSNPGTRIGRANIFYNFQNASFMQSTLTVGRQYFSIGGIPHDYMQKDILDAIVLDTKINRILEARLLLLDVYSGANNFGNDDGERWNDEFQFLTRDDAEVQEGLNGDVSTYRWGVVVSFEELFRSFFPSYIDFDFRPYFYYARVRGNGGGADRSENGQIGNFSDNDWSLMAGGRFILTLKRILMFQNISVYADMAFSSGQDIKREGEPDASYNKGAFGGGLLLDTKEIAGLFSILSELGFFYAEGSEYNAYGNMVSHGFISFKGDEIGGLLFRRYWGVHPSGYVDDDGIDNDPFDANRKSGVLMFQAGFGFKILQKLTIRADYWFSKDTSVSNVPFDKVYQDGLTGTEKAAELNPYKSKSEIEAQKRLGEILGHEINLTAKYEANKLLTFYVVVATFIPGDFFKYPIEDVASTNGVPKGAESDADFFGLAFGSELRF